MRSKLVYVSDPYKVQVFEAWSSLEGLLKIYSRYGNPTPVFLPGESQGQGSLVGCRLWGHTESDTNEAT